MCEHEFNLAAVMPVKPPSSPTAVPLWNALAVFAVVRDTCDAVMVFYPRARARPAQFPQPPNPRATRTNIAPSERTVNVVATIVM